MFPVYHPAAALHQPALRGALAGDFAALALLARDGAGRKGASPWRKRPRIR